MWSTNHRACKGNKKTTGGPREDAARPGTIVEFGDTTGASGEQLPHLPALVRTWACRRRGHEAGRSEPGDRGAAGGPGAQLSAAFFRASGQAPLRERTPGIHERPGDPCAVRRHTATPSRGGKTGKCGPRTPRGTPSLSWPPAEPQATGRNLRYRHPASRDSPFSPRKPDVQVQREQDASRPGDGAQAPPPTSPPSTYSYGLAKPQSLERRHP